MKYRARRRYQASYAPRKIMSRAHLRSHVSATLPSLGPAGPRERREYTIFLLVLTIQRNDCLLAYTFLGHFAGRIGDLFIRLSPSPMVRHVQPRLEYMRCTTPATNMLFFRVHRCPVLSRDRISIVVPLLWL